MKGTRPLSNAEIEKVFSVFDGKYAIRNRSLFMLGVSTGGRISELLSLRVGDVYQNGDPVTDLLFDKSIVKGQDESRAVPLNVDAVEAINQLIWWMDAQEMLVTKSRPLFPSRTGDGALTRKGADDAINKAFRAAGLNGKLGTHSLRKSFAQRLYTETGDIFVVKEMLGHKNVNTTQKYIGVNYKSVREALEAIAIARTEEHNTLQVYKASDDMLIAELVRRGVDIKI